MKITNTFVGGKMNMDIDQRLLPKGQYFKAMNIEVINPESNGTGSDDYGDSGVLRNSLGNLKPVSGANVPLNVTNISGAALVNPRCIGACINPQSNSIYWLITSDNEDLIVEYLDTPNVIPTGGTAGTAGAISYIARAVKGVGAVAGKYFNFNVNYPVTGINYFNGFLMWTDNLNPPRMINVNTFKAWTLPNPNFIWNQDDINVIVKPPLTSPEIELINDGSEKNYIEDKFLYFSYRYKYTDGRWSSIAPFSKTAFMPSVFSYNAYTGTNAGMQNKYNTVNITVKTGDRQVTDIQFLFKDSQFPNIYVIETINKAKPVINTSIVPDNNTWTYSFFDNSKIYATLPSSQLTRLFDNVPTKSLSQDIIGSRLIYGNYTQYYDLITQNKAKIIPNYKVSVVSDAIIPTLVSPSMKTNRDYQIGVIYLDDYGRMSTVVTSPKDTIHVPANLSGRKNWLKIEIGNYPPYWATKYRLAIRQNRLSYYNIYPIGIFLDGVYSWFRLNSNDKDKIIVGDYIIIKSNYDGQTYSENPYKVIEIKYFTPANQPEGLYFKIAYTAYNITPNISIYQPPYVWAGGWPSPPANSPANSALNPWYNLSTASFGSSYIVKYPSIGQSSRVFSVDIKYVKIIPPANDHRLIISYAGTYTISGVLYHCINYRNFNSSTATSYINPSPVPFRVASTGAQVVVPIYLSAYTTTPGVQYGNFYIGPSVPVLLGDTFRLNIFSDTVVGKTAFGASISPLSLIFPTQLLNESIKPGSEIKIQIAQGAIGTANNVVTLQQSQVMTFISSSYFVDIQEWYYEDMIYNTFYQTTSTGTTNASPIANQNVFFRFGSNISYPSYYLSSTSGTNQITTSENVDIITRRVYMLLSCSIPFTYSSNVRYFITAQGNNGATGGVFSISYQEKIFCLETLPVQNQNNIFHECTEDLPIIENILGAKRHGGNIQDQTTSLPAIIELKQSDYPSVIKNNTFNCWAFPNGVESDRIRDDFNAPTMEWSPRVVPAIEDYSEQIVSEGLTYSGVYKQDSNVNNLNQFNISLGNFKYLDKSFGSVQKIKSRNTDLVVFQQDKVSKVLFGKNLLSDSTGGGQVASIPEVLGTQIAYQGEFGISNNPESFAQWDDNMFFTDSQRGAVLRLGNDGIFEISSNGMRSFFNTSFKSQPDTLKIGVFDPYYKRYILAETEFTKSQSLPSITVYNGPDSGNTFFPLGENPTIFIQASGGALPA